METIQPCTLPEAAELADLLTRYEIEGLLFAHDAIARDCSPDRISLTSPENESSMMQERPTVNENEDSNIKIIKIEKTNEPLVSTKLPQISINILNVTKNIVWSCLRTLDLDFVFKII